MMRLNARTAENRVMRFMQRVVMKSKAVRNRISSLYRGGYPDEDLSKPRFDENWRALHFLP